MSNVLKLYERARTIAERWALESIRVSEDTSMDPAKRENIVSRLSFDSGTMNAAATVIASLLDEDELPQKAAIEQKFVNARLQSVLDRHAPQGR